ncbi:DDE superfamily endonuclease [Rhizobium sp. RU20A]|nr:DDE superfamily endonuclease [Rhizobium sp. RU20A]
MPWCDTYAMTQHLAEISRHVADDAHSILIMDQAAWHMSNNLVILGNISILPLPPKSPELNPVENLWHFMHENWLSNRVFKSMTISSLTAVTLGESPKTSLGASCPSDEENGQMGSDQ